MFLELLLLLPLPGKVLISFLIDTILLVIPESHRRPLPLQVVALSDGIFQLFDYYFGHMLSEGGRLLVRVVRRVASHTLAVAAT